MQYKFGTSASDYLIFRQHSGWKILFILLWLGLASGASPLFSSATSTKASTKKKSTIHLVSATCFSQINAELSEVKSLLKNQHIDPSSVEGQKDLANVYQSLTNKACDAYTASAVTNCAADRMAVDMARTQYQQSPVFRNLYGWLLEKKNYENAKRRVKTFQVQTGAQKARMYVVSLQADLAGLDATSPGQAAEFASLSTGGIEENVVDGVAQAVYDRTATAVQQAIEDDVVSVLTKTCATTILLPNFISALQDLNLTNTASSVWTKTTINALDADQNELELNLPAAIGFTFEHGPKLTPKTKSVVGWSFSIAETAAAIDFGAKQSPKWDLTKILANLGPRIPDDALRGRVMALSAAAQYLSNNAQTILQDVTSTGQQDADVSVTISSGAAPAFSSACYEGAPASVTLTVSWNDLYELAMLETTKTAISNDAWLKSFADLAISCTSAADPEFNASKVESQVMDLADSLSAANVGGKWSVSGVQGVISSVTTVAESDINDAEIDKSISVTASQLSCATALLGKVDDALAVSGSAGVASYIEATALPADSAFAKRQIGNGQGMSWNLYIQSYVGGGAYLPENALLPGGSPNTVYKVPPLNNLLSFSVPIGLEVPVGAGLGIMASVVDFREPVADLINGGKNAAVVTNDLFAPGLFLTWGWKHPLKWLGLPIAFGAGYDWQNTPTSNMVGRINTFIALDFPWYRASGLDLCSLCGQSDSGSAK